MFTYLHIIYGCLLTTTASSCDRDWMALKAKYICYVALYKKKCVNSCLLLLLVLMYVLLLKQLLADIGTTDHKMTGKLRRPELHVTLVKRLWNDLNLACHKPCWLHCWCYFRLNHPTNIELLFSDVIVSWKPQEQTSLYAFWVGTSRISFEGSVFSHCQSSWEEGDSGVEKEDSRNMP